MHSYSRLAGALLALSWVTSISFFTKAEPASSDGNQQDQEPARERRREDRSGQARAGAGEEEKDTEITVVPFVGGNSDVGLGGGYIASIADMEPGYEPYVFRVESAGTITFQSEGDGLRIPFVDNYLLLSMPHVVKDRVRIEARVSYTREATLKYYGLGNAATIPAGRDPSSAYFEHSRVHPTALFNAEYRHEDVRLNWGVAYTQNSFEIPDDGKLAEDMRNGSERVRRLLAEAESHGSMKLSVGVGLDTRDDEVSPQHGIYHTARVDLSPGSLGERATIGRWGRLNGAVRFYETIAPRRLVFALRVLGDLLFGEAPFYELPRFDETFAIGGARGLRGVPAQRYYGKIKAFVNAELRSELFEFDLFGSPRRVGLTGFGDFGRSWADYQSDPELDGEGLGLKYGLGGGLRLTSGTSFVLRLDVAWSPDAHPVSGYLISGHHF